MAWQEWLVWGFSCVAVFSSAGEVKGQKPPPTPLGTSPAALVNGEPISLAEVDAVHELIPSKGNALTPSEIRQNRLDILDMLIDDVLIHQFLKKKTTPVTQAEFSKEWELLHSSLKARNRTLEEFLKDTKQTEAHLRTEIVKKLQWERYLSQHITEAALKRYYEENREYYDMVKVQIRHILIRVSPKQGESERNLARARLEQLRGQLLANQITFEDAARKYSQCESASKGGDLGYFIRKFVLDERVAKAAFALKVGEISEPVETEYGLHLLKVTDRTKGEPSQFETIKDKVRQHYAMDLCQNIIGQERQTARIETRLP
jgi:hypothetical protein